MLAKTLLGLLGLVSTTLAAFGLTDNTDTYVIDTGSANTLIATIQKASCDVTSLVYRGTELQGPQSQGTHIGSGLGTATVAAETISGRYNGVFDTLF